MLLAWSGRLKVGPRLRFRRKWRQAGHGLLLHALPSSYDDIQHYDNDNNDNGKSWRFDGKVSRSCFSRLTFTFLKDDRNGSE